jgi:hypothetical protein
MTANRHIVIINTSFEYLESMHRVLTLEEYAVSTYLLEDFLSQPLTPPLPDLIMLDYHPGLEQQSSIAYEWLRHQEVTAHIPLIIATTSPIAFEVRFPTRDSHTHILSEPFMTGTLLRLIGQLLDHPDDFA